MNLPKCKHRGRIDEAKEEVECFSNRFLGTDYEWRPADLCSHCPFINRPNRQKRNLALPSPIQQAKNLSSALAQHVKAGLSTTPEEEQTLRLQICEGCERRTDDWRCAECGCYLREKVKWAEQECPLGNWVGGEPHSGKSGCGCG